MSFMSKLKRDLRRQGVYLDAEQALVILQLANAGRRHMSTTPEEEDTLRRFKQRCQELRGATWQ